MSTYPTLACSLRTGIGSNASKQLRHQGLLPASVFGHGDPLSLTLDLRQFNVVMHDSHSGSQLVNLTIDGVDSGLALIKAVQRETLKRTPLHLDLQRISLKEKLHVTVNVILLGESVGVKEGGVLLTTVHSLHLLSAADTIPDNVSFDISHMKIGDMLTAGEITLPEGCELLDSPTENVAQIRQPLRVVEEVAETETPAAE